MNERQILEDRIKSVKGHLQERKDELYNYVKSPSTNVTGSEVVEYGEAIKRYEVALKELEGLRRRFNVI